MEVVSLNKVYVSHWYVCFLQPTATLVATQIALQLQLCVPQKVQFFAPVEPVFPILRYAEIHRPVVLRILTASALNHMHAQMVNVWQHRANASPLVVMQLILVISQHQDKVKTQIVAVFLVKSCVLMVNVCLKVAHLLARSLPLVPLEHTDGGMEVARILPITTIRYHARFQVMLVVRMGGAVTRNYPMMVAVTTKRPGINVQIATVPMVQTRAKLLPLEILQVILALIPHVYLEHAVVCLLHRKL